MPFYQSPGGSTFNPEWPTVGVQVMKRLPDGTTTATEQSRPIVVALEEASALKGHPAITAPDDLPDNATPGTMLTSASSPDAIFVSCPDGVWRAFPTFRVP